MEKEMEQSKQQMRNFKLSKLVVLINSLVVRQTRNFKFAGFSQLQAHNLELALKFKKLQKHVFYSKKYKIIRNWNQYVKNQQHQREIEQYE